MNKYTNLGFSIAILLLLIQSSVASNCTVQDCTTCQTSDTCEICSGSFKSNIDKKQCVVCDVDNCTVCESDSSCSICQDGYSLSKNNTSSGNGTGNLCFLCDVDNCDSCIANGECGDCAQGYTLTEGSCQLCAFPCETCNSELKCQTCKTPEYFKFPDAQANCYAHKVPFCAIYDIPNYPNCQECQQNYVLDAQNNTCNRNCTYPCLACSGDSCSSCQIGYYLDSETQKCKACGNGCEVCDSTKCLLASPGFYINGKSISLCMSFCKTCSSANSCITYSNFFLGFIFFFFNGNFVLAQCAEGCLRCSPSNINKCLEAKPGYILGTDGNVKHCAQKCKTCANNNTQKCLSCYKNTFLSSGQCVQCDPTCLTCQSALSLTTCTTCKQGSYLDGTKCVQGCPQNCLACSNAHVCVKCQSGFTLLENTQTSSFSCSPCVGSCRNCAQGKPDVCLQCGDGSFLKSGSCSSCSSFCKKCTQSGCSQCYQGFRLGSDKTCIQNCKQPCATCSQNPFVCLSCILGYKFDASIKKCLPELSCVGGCTYCPVGYGLNEGQCNQCTGTGCRTCSSGSLDTCTSCIGGYFLKPAVSTCAKCSASCDTCVSRNVCTSCASGYTSTPSSIFGAGFTCLKCSAQCKTCFDQVSKCTTCADGYQFSGCKCVKKHRFIFGCRLGVRLGFFRLNLFRFIARLMFGFGRNTLAFSKISQGSVVVQGSVDPTGQPGSESFNTEFEALSNTLSQGGSIGGMSVQSSSTSLSAAVSSQSSDNVGLILGICIPVGILILAAIALVIYKINTKNKLISEQGEKDQKTGNESSQGFGSNSVKYDL